MACPARCPSPVAVRRVTDIMGEISAASEEQSSGIEQVNQTIVQMDETTQQNAALVEEASAAAGATLLDEVEGLMGRALEARSRALVLSMGKKDPLVKLLMCVHSQTHPDFSAQWADVDARWMVDPSAAETDEDDLLVMLLSTGLWVHDHLNQRKLSPANRQRMVDRLFRLIDAPSKTTEG